MLKFICYPKCTTCQKAKRWLDEHGIVYELRDIKLDNPTREELTEWHQKSGLPLRRFFNTSGLLYKSLDLKNKLFAMGEDEMLALLASDGMLVKRPSSSGRIMCSLVFRKRNIKASCNLVPLCRYRIRDGGFFFYFIRERIAKESKL